MSVWCACDRFLTHLDDKQMMTLMEAFEGVDKKTGDVIIKQGQHIVTHTKHTHMQTKHKAHTHIHIHIHPPPLARDTRSRGLASS